MALHVFDKGFDRSVWRRRRWLGEVLESVYQRNHDLCHAAFINANSIGGAADKIVRDIQGIEVFQLRSDIMRSPLVPKKLTYSGRTTPNT